MRVSKCDFFPVIVRNFMSIDMDNMSVDDAVALAESDSGDDMDALPTDEPTDKAHAGGSPAPKTAKAKPAPTTDDDATEAREAFADKLDHMDGDALRKMYGEVYGEPRKVAPRNDKLDRLRAAIMAKRFPPAAKVKAEKPAKPAKEAKAKPKAKPKAEKPKTAKTPAAKAEKPAKVAKTEKPKAEPKTPAPKKEAKPKANKTPKPAKEGGTPQGGWRHDMTAKIEESTLNPREVKVLEALRSAKGAGAEGLSVGEMAKLCFSGLRKAEGTYEGGGEKAEKGSMKPAYRAVLNSLRKLVAGQYAEKCARGVYRIKGKK